MKKLLLILIFLICTIFLPSTFADSTPDWVKNIAGWWATDTISENEFLNSMKFLIKTGIIDVEIGNKCHKELSEISNDLEKINEICGKTNLEIITEIIPFDTSSKINKKGFTGDDFPSQKQDNEFRIFMFGGSVIQGTGNSSKETTIPFILQKMIEKTNHEEIRIINGAGSAGNSIYQTELINTNLSQYEPDLVMVLLGWNDLSSDYPVKGIKTLWNDACQSSKKNNFEIMIFIQPIVGFGNKELTEQEQINSLTGEDHNGYQLSQAKSTYDFLVRELKTLNEFCDIVDSRDVFDHIVSPVYWDQGHMSDLGNLIMADMFHKELSKKFNNQFNYNSEFYNAISKYNNSKIDELIFSELGIDVDFDGIPVQDEMKIEGGKGSYFKLKHKFGLDGILVGKDLQEADLSRIIFEGQDLTGANLSGHDLRNVDLSKIIIRGANLSDTNLEGKDMSGMDLRGINFMGANLKDVNFTDAIFSKPIQIEDEGDCSDMNPIHNIMKNANCVAKVIENESIRTNFENADLTNSKFGTLNEGKNQMIYFANFKNADLTNVDLYGAQFFGCNFNNAQLNEITAKSMFILKSDFNNTKINNFKIEESWIQATSFNNVQMTNGVFDDVRFIDTYFPETNLEGTKFIGNIEGLSEK